MTTSLRRRLAVGSAVASGLTLWALAGAPWWAPAIGFGVVLLLRVLAPVLPRVVLVRAVPLGAVVAVAATLSALPPAAWLLLFAEVLAVVALLAGPRLPSHPPSTLLLLVGAGLLVVAGTAGLVIAKIEADRERAIAAEHESDVLRARMLPRSPQSAVRAVVNAIADNDPAMCTAFTPAAREQFATANGASTCAGAIAALHQRVSDPHKYESPDVYAVRDWTTPDREIGSANGCTLSWDAPFGNGGPAPGPQFGVITAHRELGQGYRITAYAPCPP